MHAWAATGEQVAYSKDSGPIFPYGKLFGCPFPHIYMFRCQPERVLPKLILPHLGDFKLQERNKKDNLCLVSVVFLAHLIKVQRVSNILLQLKSMAKRLLIYVCLECRPKYGK